MLRAIGISITCSALAFARPAQTERVIFRLSAAGVQFVIRYHVKKRELRKFIIHLMHLIFRFLIIDRDAFPLFVSTTYNSKSCLETTQLRTINWD